MSESEQGDAAGLSWSALTDTGRFRKNNEDAFLALTFDDKEVRRLGKIGEADFTQGDFIFAVSDGMGGHKAGEFASRIAVERITESFPRYYRLGAMGIEQGASDVLGNLFTDIHRSIIKMGQAYEECRGMGATLSLAWFHPGRMAFCHVGDSRIYYLPANGKLKQLTEDHTYVGWLLRTGKINATQARFHPKKNQLSQALIADLENLDPQHGTVLYEPGDRFILCSDGVTDGLSDNGLQHLLVDKPPTMEGISEAEGIVREAIANSGRDNTTAVIIEIDSSGHPHLNKQ